jgi:ABC-type transporter Mla subunit MlaD
MTALEGQVSAAQSQLRELLQGLGATREALVTTSDALAMNADQFRESSGRLDGAVAALAGASAQAVDDSMEAVREELQAAVQGMISGMTDTSQRTVAAYEDASRKVAEALDEQMTDLADRLRGELATLAAQLPAEMQKLHEASAAIKSSVDRALKSLDAAVGQLSSQSTEVMRAHLVEYERAVASAITHFSGTLTLWETRTAALEHATTGLADVVRYLGEKSSVDGKAERP